jgi:hypothetical protein
MQMQQPEVSRQAGDLTGVRRCRRPLRRAALWVASFPAAASGFAFAAWGFSGVLSWYEKSSQNHASPDLFFQFHREIVWSKISAARA